MGTSAADLLNEMDGEGATSGNPLDSLLEEVENEDTTPSWTPDEPASVAGEIVSITATKSDYHDRPVPVWKLKLPDGEFIRVAGFRSVLEREMNESDASVGDLAAVKYFGKMLKKNAKPGSKKNDDYFQKYRVITRSK
jgi:hypothetical protein